EVLQEFPGRLIRVQEEERRRIGRELHDDLSQQLALLGIRLESLRKQWGASSLELDSGMIDLWEQINDITESVHRMSHGMHSAVLEQLGLVLGLRSLVAEFVERRGIRVEFDTDAMPGNMAAEVALCLFRVVQESLNNIAKHSGAHSARIELRLRDDGVHLTIEDHGAGFGPQEIENKTGLGFIS